MARLPSISLLITAYRFKLRTFPNLRCASRVQPRKKWISGPRYGLHGHRDARHKNPEFANYKRANPLAFPWLRSPTCKPSGTNSSSILHAPVTHLIQIVYAFFGASIWLGPRIGKYVNAEFGFAKMALAVAVGLGVYTLFFISVMPKGKPDRETEKEVAKKGKKDGDKKIRSLTQTLGIVCRNKGIQLLLLTRAFHSSSAHLALATIGLFSGN